MRLGIVTGGHGPERSGALLSGKHVEEACACLGIQAQVYDAATLNFHELRQVDCVFLTTHGWYGEDGKLQGTLDMFRIPYSGSGVAASSAAYFKPFANAIAERAGLRIPRSQVIDLSSHKTVELDRLHHNLGPSLFIKPASNGCSQGARILKNAEDIDDWLLSAKEEECPIFLVAEHISGKDVSVGIVEIQGEPFVLPLLETRHDDQFYSFDVKSGKSRRDYICPAEISNQSAQRVKDHALGVYKALGCRGFARVDFIVTNDAPWFLEVNTIPGFSKNGNLAQMAYAHGWDYARLVSQLIATIDMSVLYRP